MKRIVISRTDSIGDVVLTLPLAGALKSVMPDAQIGFIGQRYTLPVIEASEFVDKIWERQTLLDDADQLRHWQPDALIYAFPDRRLAKSVMQAAPIRVGTAHRWFHWLYATHRPRFSRRKSGLHESQLNFQLLHPLGIALKPSLAQIPDWYGLRAQKQDFSTEMPDDRPRIILHPKSKGSALEWPLEHFVRLAKQLLEAGINVIISGTEAERQLILAQCPELLSLAGLHDLTGKLSLAAFVNLIGASDGLVACSTGPLHIAAALGKVAVGIYPPYEPIHPGRWRPVGKRATVLTAPGQPLTPRKNWDVQCLAQIQPDQVFHALQSNLSLK